MMNACFPLCMTAIPFFLFYGYRFLLLFSSRDSLSAGELLRDKSVVDYVILCDFFLPEVGNHFIPPRIFLNSRRPY